MDYLPNGEGSTKQFGGFHVTIKQITEKPDYVLTVLSIAEGKVRQGFPFPIIFFGIPFVMSLKVLFL